MLYTVKEVCHLLKVHRNTVRAMINDGRLQAIDINPRGGRPVWRVKVDDLLAGNPEDHLKILDIERRAGL
ncbi:MAG: helix-turn-helix domain-containing protein [Desulfobaccales bacterium]